MSQSLPAKAQPAPVPQEARKVWSESQVEVIRRTLAPGCSFGELELFASVCRNSGFDPFLREIYLMPVGGKHVPFVAIDGYRKKAAEYDKVTPPDIDVTWLPDGSVPDFAVARGEVMRGGRWVPLVCKVRWVERKPVDGKDATWRKMPEGQLSKCAEALYYRMSGCPGLQGLNLIDEKHMYEAREEGDFACEECSAEITASEASLSKKAHGRPLCREHRPRKTMASVPTQAPPAEAPATTPEQSETGEAPETADSDEVQALRAALNRLNSAQARQVFQRAGVTFTKELASLSADQLTSLMLEAGRA